MNTTAFAVRLTIPDNEARTAAVTLAALGVEFRALERADVWIFEVAGGERGAGGTGDSLEQAVRADESIFNPNKHRLEPLAHAGPGKGEVWVENDLPVRLGKASWGGCGVRRLVAWRLRAADGSPAAREVVAAAAERLLCNSAYQRAFVLP